MKKWSLRLLLVVLAVVTCSFIFRSTEDAENDYGSLDQLDPEEMLLYEEAKTMTENYLSMTCIKKSTRYLIMLKILEKGDSLWSCYIGIIDQE